MDHHHQTGLAAQYPPSPRARPDPRAKKQGHP